jgi:hypothetical protein
VVTGELPQHFDGNALQLEADVESTAQRREAVVHRRPDNKNPTASGIAKDGTSHEVQTEPQVLEFAVGEQYVRAGKQVRLRDH